MTSVTLEAATEQLGRFAASKFTGTAIEDLNPDQFGILRSMVAKADLAAWIDWDAKQ